MPELAGDILRRRMKFRREITWTIFVMLLIFFGPMVVGEVLGVRPWGEGAATRLRDWYSGKIRLYPFRATLTPALVIFQLASVWTLRKSIPTWGKVRANRGDMETYFWINTAFWFALFIQVPLVFILFLINAPYWMDLAAFLLVFTLAAFSIFKVSRRPEVDLKKFRAIITPVISGGPPGFTALVKLHKLRMLPDWLSHAVEWIVSLIQSVVMSTAKLVLVI